MLACQHCEKTCGNLGGLAAHERVCKLNPNRVKLNRSPFAGKKKGSVAWNKGLKGSDHISEAGRKAMSEAASRVGASRVWSESSRQKNREAALAKGLGGYQEGSGRGKKGRYKGFFCDSSWELAFVIYHLDHGIHLERNKVKLPYEFEGVSRSYTPDFVLGDSLIEIKGYWTEQDLAKAKQHPQVKVLQETEMIPYISYVVKKYGKDFIRLYE